MLNEDKFSRPRPRTSLRGRGRRTVLFSESTDNVQEIIISMQTISHHFNLSSLLLSQLDHLTDLSRSIMYNIKNTNNKQLESDLTTVIYHDLQVTIALQKDQCL